MNLTDISPFNYYSAPSPDTKHPSVVSAAAKTVFQTPNTPPRCLHTPFHGTPPSTKRPFPAPAQ